MRRWTRSGRTGSVTVGNNDDYIVRGDRLPSHSHDEDGNERPVNRVTASNRYDVSSTHPHLEIALMSEDLSEWLYAVYIPNTREMPDAVIYEGFHYEVVDTRLKPPQYRQCMVATAYDNPEKDDKHGT